MVSTSQSGVPWQRMHAERRFEQREAWLRVPAALTSGFCINAALERMKRAQGRPGDRCTRGPRAKRIARRARDHRYRRRHSGLPRAVVLRLISALPGEPAFATVAPARPLESSKGLAPARARQDHTTSPSANVPHVNRHIRVHIIPHQVRDDAYVPLIGSGMATAEHKFRKYET